MNQATADLNALAAQQPSGLVETLRKELAVDRAEYAFRAAARQEELRVYELAGYASVESAVVPLLPPAYQGPIENTIAALHSLYILGGIDQYYLVNVHFTHPYSDARPVSALRSYYLEAQNRYGVDAYLAHNGAPYNMRNAIWHYNLDYDYVDAVESFARAYRTDPGWLDRMYYWNTYG